MSRIGSYFAGGKGIGGQPVDPLTRYRVLFEHRDDGVRYMRVMTYEEACAHAYQHRARVVSLDKLEGKP